MPTTPSQPRSHHMARMQAFCAIVFQRVGRVEQSVHLLLPEGLSIVFLSKGSILIQRRHQCNYTIKSDKGAGSTVKQIQESSSGSTPPPQQTSPCSLMQALGHHQGLAGRGDLVWKTADRALALPDELPLLLLDHWAPQPFRGQGNETGKRAPALSSQSAFVPFASFGLTSFSRELAPSDSTNHGGWLRAKCTSLACTRDLEQWRAGYPRWVLELTPRGNPAAIIYIRKRGLQS